jgi:DNA polymerase (family 10)
LNTQLAKIAKNEGIKLVINSDAHNKRELHNIKFGIYIARRAGLSKEDIYEI